MVGSIASADLKILDVIVREMSGSGDETRTSVAESGRAVWSARSAGAIGAGLDIDSSADMIRSLLAPGWL